VNPWLAGCLALVLFGLVPALLLCWRGRTAQRLAGLQLAGSVTVLLLVLWCQAIGQPGYLVVPLVLVLLSFAGTLVFTRLVGKR
jgi:multisubunit Na+/H+ antiporter MnhF subunit